MNILMNSAIKEIFLFNSFESMLFLSIYMIDNSIKANNIKLKIVFHVLMVSVLNYIIFSIFTVPILMQIIFLLSMSIYFAVVFHKRIVKSIIIVLKSFAMLMILEIVLAIVFRILFHVELVSMDDNFQKFIFMIPFRLIEAVGIYGYYIYKLKKRGGK